MKRVLKLSQIKQTDYFKDFSWDSLLSFNLDAPYSVEMPQDNLKEISTYQDYIQENLQDFKPPGDSKPDLEYKKKVDEWFNSL